MSNVPTIALMTPDGGRDGHANSGNAIASSSRPITALRMGPLTCFCACTPQKAAASTMVDGFTEFRPAEEVFDSPASNVNNLKSLPSPEGPSGDVFTGPTRKEERFNIHQQTVLPKLVPEELTSGPPVVRKEEVPASKASTSSPAEAYKQSHPKEVKTEQEQKFKKVAIQKEPIFLQKVHQEMQQEHMEQKFREDIPYDIPQVSQLQPQPGTEVARKPILKRLCLIFCAVLLASVLIAGAVQLHSWSSVRVPQTIAEMRGSRCHISGGEKVSTDEQKHTSYTFPLGFSQSVTIPASFNVGGRIWSLPTIDLDWMAVTCWVSLTESLEADFQREDGRVPLTIFYPQNMIRFDLPPLRCSEEVAQLADQDDGFDCSYAQTGSDGFGVMAASKEELSHSSFAVALWRYSRTGFPFSVFGACVAFSAISITLAFVAKVCFWNRCTCRCWTYSIVSVSFLLTALGIGWIVYQCNRKSRFFANLKGGTCNLLSNAYRGDPQEHADYKVAGSRVTLPGSISLRGHIWEAPVVSADWAMVTCWVDLGFPSDFEAVPHSSDGKVPLTWIDMQTLTPNSDKLHCSSVVEKLASAGSFKCAYSEGAFDGLGVLAVSKEVVPTTFPRDIILELAVATRTGFPFLVCLIATCVTVLFAAFKILQACGRWLKRRCLACRKDAAAREETLSEIHEPLLGRL